MKAPKPRKEKLSIYLAKNTVADDVGKIIKTEKAKPPINIEVQGYEATLYVKKEPPKPSPPWTRLFTEKQDLPEDLFGSSRAVGAVLVAKLNRSSPNKSA